MIKFDHTLGAVVVTADNGEVRTWPLDEFMRNEASCVAQTGNGITPPTPEPAADEKIAMLEKRNALLEAALLKTGVVKPDDLIEKEER